MIGAAFSSCGRYRCRYRRWYRCWLRSIKADGKAGEAQIISAAPRAPGSMLRRLWACAALCVVAGPAAGDAWAGLDDFARLDAMQADFKQTVRNENGAVVSEARGVMWLRRPGRIRWEYTQPDPQVFIAKQGQWLHYDPLLLQVVVRPVSDLLERTPLSLLLGLRKKHFTARALERRDAGLAGLAGLVGLEWVAVTPKSAASEFTRVDIGLKQGVIRHLTLHGRAGNRTDIAFTRVATDVQTADHTFGLHLPQGVDVLGDAASFMLP